MQKREFLWQVRIAGIAQFGKHLLCELFRADEDLPDLPHDGLQEFDTALLACDDPLPIPLVDVSRVIVIQEIIFSHRPHVGADTFAWAAVKLFQCDSLPLGGRLNDLGVDRILATVVRDTELNRGTRSVAVEHVIDAALGIDNQRNLHHHEAEFFA